MRLDAVLHSNEKVKEVLRNFVLVNLGPRDKETEGLQVQYIPLMVFYSPSGQEIKRKVGSLPPLKLIDLLNEVLDSAQEE